MTILQILFGFREKEAKHCFTYAFEFFQSIGHRFNFRRLIKQSFAKNNIFSWVLSGSNLTFGFPSKIKIFHFDLKFSSSRALIWNLSQLNI